MTFKAFTNHYLPLLVSTALILTSAYQSLQAQNKSFTLQQVKSYPFPTGLTASAKGSRIAWAFNEEGKRNIYVAEGPEFKSRRLTSYLKDDGQALSSVSISQSGDWIVYIRGGDFGSNWNDALPVNPTFDPVPPKVQIWSMPFVGGEPILLGEGESPTISPDGKKVAFIKSGQIWITNINDSSSAKKMFTSRGTNGQPKWSSDGTKLAFRSSRGDHSFIGIYHDKDTPITWITPSFYRDHTPRWSPDGSKITFIRQPGRGGAPKTVLEGHHNPWKIMIADVTTGKAQEGWVAPETMRGSLPTTQGRTNLNWGDGRIVFLSYHDGWPHLYSIAESGGDELLLTPGEYMAEYITLSPNGKWLLFTANSGNDPLDIERRHIVRVPVDSPEPEVMTPGEGIEWTPVITGGGNKLAYISATAQRPPLPTVMNLKDKKSTILAMDLIPKDFPSKNLVTPTQVIFKAPDGTPVHATMFNSGESKKPAIVYVHGGPPRQMLLGWHYSSYYSNAYAMNQYLASQGYVVLSVNYRLGIGYGYEFHRPIDGGSRGASEYQDVKAGAEWLADQDFVDSDRIGIYGGSYGGFLTAMALGRDSDLFAAGVDIHGVHERTSGRTNNLIRPNRYERAPDAETALKVAWESSPASSVPTWKSPVLIIHADDDRNVAFSQSTDLVQRLREARVDLETMVIVDDTHHFMMHANQMKVNLAVAEYFGRKLK
jgi:dipeptidyl aminopeptidase/acylaminoacyl peptidase